jgi:pimeloyl-ACP methyl ester carboxylesterase
MRASDGRPHAIATHFGDIVLEDSGADPGATPLLLIHAIASSARMWDAVRHRLPGDVRLLTPDLLGHGRSDQPRRPLGITDHADLLADLLAGSDVHRCCVAGCSLGALIALELAARHPTLVAGAVCNGLPGWGGEAQRMARFASLVEKVGPDGLPDPAAPLGGTVQPMTPEVEEQRRRDRTRCGRSFLNSLWAVAAFDPIARLPRVGCPVLVLMGGADPHLGSGPIVADGLPRGRLLVLPNAGHLTPFDDPAGVATAIRTVVGSSLERTA